MKWVNHCTAWVRTKTSLFVLMGGLICLVIVGRNLSSIAVAGSIPILLGIACLLPCLIPLLALRRRYAKPEEQQPTAKG